MLWSKIGGFVMMLGVIMGAFGAHALKNRLEAPMMDVYRTAVSYHLIHGLGLFVVAWLLSYTADPRLWTAGLLFTIGLVLFSGSLYALALTGIKGFGAITPFGGLCWIFAWLLIALSKFRV